ncbi:DUF1376 domain-containing protein [Devosia sp. BSSL-BM10]|uniref:DUF1376 domain-containing protein n=1 Tax=Devosia litorisediminis TaxID=2829817 RepID=A0A942EGW3_9HYPH|nr:DUF1376 domain-containing protein [Devosia litorisediminis]MBS3849706.1 DUF1376 domain-containing protein [Devosia litorisediminis]
MTSSPRWFRFFPTDWLSRIGDLSPAERGVMLTLVCLMFDRGEPLSRDDARLARQCGIPTAGFRTALAALLHQGKLAETDGMLWADWVDMEIRNTSQKSRAASRSAKARWGEKDNKNNGGGDAFAMQTHSDRNATQNHKETPIGPEGPNASIDLSGMSREIQTYTSLGINREAALGVECHRCGATPNAPCVGTDGAQRARSHIQRYQLVAHHRNVPTASTGGELPVIREDDPIAPFLAKVRGKPIYWGTRSCTTATPAEMDAARALAGAA